MTGMPRFSLATEPFAAEPQAFSCECGRPPHADCQGASWADLARRLCRLDEVWTCTSNRVVTFAQRWTPQGGRCTGDEVLIEGRDASLLLSRDAEGEGASLELGVAESLPRWTFKGRDGRSALTLWSESARGQLELGLACGLIAKGALSAQSPAAGGSVGLRRRVGEPIAAKSERGGHGLGAPTDPASLRRLRPDAFEVLVQCIARQRLPLRVRSGFGGVLQQCDLRFHHIRRPQPGECMLESDRARLTLRSTALGGLWAADSHPGDRSRRSVCFCDHWGRTLLTLDSQPGFGGADHPLWETLINSLLDQAPIT